MGNGCSALRGPGTLALQKYATFKIILLKILFRQPCQTARKCKGKQRTNTHTQTCSERRVGFGFSFVVSTAVVTSSVGFRRACTLPCTNMNCELRTVNCEHRANSTRAAAGRVRKQSKANRVRSASEKL